MTVLLRLCRSWGVQAVRFLERLDCGWIIVGDAREAFMPLLPILGPAFMPGTQARFFFAAGGGTRRRRVPPPAANTGLCSTDPA